MPGAPKAWAASSISGTPSEASSASGARRPNRWTGMIAFVRLGDPVGDVLRVEVQRGGVDVREDRRRAASRDRLCGRIESERRTEDLVARPDPHRVEDEHEVRRCRSRRRRALDPEVGGCLLLERLHIRAADELSGLEDPRTGSPAPPSAARTAPGRQPAGSSARQSILAPHPAMPATARNGCGTAQGCVLSRARISLMRALLASFPCLLLARPDWGSPLHRARGWPPASMTQIRLRWAEDRPGDDVFREPELVEVLPLQGRPPGLRPRTRTPRRPSRGSSTACSDRAA